MKIYMQIIIILNFSNIVINKFCKNVKILNESFLYIYYIMSYKEKYAKYKQKYLNLKKKT
jgi:hypothetical protein